MGADLGQLEERFNYVFRSRDLLLRALTHKSRSSEETSREGGPSEDNEQLEFLGDAVLGFLVSEALVSYFPEMSEGDLSKTKARLVSANHLHGVALSLELGDHLLLGRGEELSGGRKKKALLANSLEAVIAAVYVDGGHEAARRFVMERIVGQPELISNNKDEVSDAKGALQEFAQAHGLPPPRYRVARTSGPEHSKTFLVEVSLGEAWAACGEGSSKKAAGRQAAAGLLQVVKDAFPSQ